MRPRRPCRLGRIQPTRGGWVLRSVESVGGRQVRLAGGFTTRGTDSVGHCASFMPVQLGRAEVRPTRSVLTCQSRFAAIGSYEDLFEVLGLRLAKYRPVTAATSGDEAR